MKPFDVVVVGARCAGSPLAAMLAQRGVSVCLVDRARFPSETPSTHVIQPCGVQMLDQLGVLKDILAAGAVGQPGTSSAVTTSLLRGISVDADATRSFLRVINHDLRPSQLFTPVMLARATARAIRDEPGHIFATLQEAFASGRQNMREARQKRVKPPGMSGNARRVGEGLL